MADNAVFDSWVVPAPMATSAYVSVTITMINTGDTTWTQGDGYALVALSPTDTVWGTPSIPAPPIPVLPGQRWTFQTSLHNPGTPGSHPFQWQMKRGTQAFGAPTPALQVDVVKQVLGTEHQTTRMLDCVRTSEEVTAFVTMKNTGNTAWTWGDVRLRVYDQDGTTNWHAQNTHIPIGLFVPPGDVYTFKPTLTAPATAGQQKIQAQLETFTAVAIGSPTPATTVRVSDRGGLIAVSSLPVASTGAVTRLEVDSDSSTFTKVELAGTAGNQAMAKKAFTFETKKLSLFVLRFHAFDLQTGKRCGDFQEYGVTGRKAVVRRVDDHTLELCWTLAPASGTGIECGGRRLTLDPRIEVTVWVRGRHDRNDPETPLPAGWLDLDIAFTYPEIDPPAARYGWEAEILFPHLKLLSPKGRRLLDGTGYLGPLAERTTDGERNTDYSPVPVQLAAVFEAPANVIDDTVFRGVIVTGTDVLGHWKRLMFEQTTGGDASKHFTTVAFSLTNSIFVKAVGSPPGYRAAPPGRFTLSTRSEDGFRGANMRYRISAFHLESASINPKGTLSWHDVAALYRDQAWSSTLCKSRESFGLPKHVSGAPLDVMAPHTVIANYALDGPVQVKDPQHPGGAPPHRAHWMEVHPMKDGERDFPAPGDKSQPPSVQDLAETIRTRVNATLARIALEVQIWGYEVGGLYYRFIGGYPPITDVLHETYGAASRFKAALDRLAKARLVPILTTTPYSQQWNGVRFRGHLLKQANGQWQNALPWDWPANILTTATAAGIDASNRTFRVAFESDNELSGHADALKLYPSLASEAGWAEQLSPDPNKARRGPLDVNGPKDLFALSSRLFCPLPHVSSLYLQRWLKDAQTGLVKAYGLRLLEFMILHRADYFCYDAGHSHVPASHDAVTAGYDNVIGVGLHYVRRLKSALTEVLETLHAAAKAADPAHAWSALTHEHVPIEALVPWVDEFYEHDTSSILVWRGDTTTTWKGDEPDHRNQARAVPIFHYVYSKIASAKMNLADRETTLFPGYVEKNGTLPPRRLPGFKPGDPPAADEAALDASFDAWRKAARDDAASFSPDPDPGNPDSGQPGIAPRGYTLTLPNGTSSPYDFHRAAQSIFNLRSEIYRLGMAAVRGERILLPSTWFEGQKAYNSAAVDMGVAAAHMQMNHHAFFRGGVMLGPVDVEWPEGASRTVWAWRANKRHFIDVLDLAKEVHGMDVESSKEQLSLFDFISRGIDTRKIRPINEAAAASAGKPYNPNRPPVLNGVLITTDRVHHLVWKLDEAPNLLYVFANVGDNLVKLDVIYARGTKGVPKWKRSVLTFDGKTPDGTAGASDTIAPGAKKSIEIPARNVVTVTLVPA